MKKRDMKWCKFKLVLFLITTLLYACGSEDVEVIPEDEKEEIVEESEEENKEMGEEFCSDTTYHAQLPELTDEIELSNWTLKWEDNFDYEDSKLDDNWTSQNGSSGHILCSRWRENAVVKDGILELKAIKENRGGQEWSCGNIWTKQAFKYGYFECKYKYAGASGTNNSFWLFSTSVPISGPVLTCELDVNEGHYPNEVNTNVHHWQNGTTENDQLAYAEGLSPAYAQSFESPVKTNKIRFSSKNASHFHIREFRIYEPNEGCYPENLLAAGADSEVSGLTNLSRDSQVSIVASGVFRDDFKISSVTDSNPNTSWVSQSEGEKWLEFTWPTEKEIGHIQFINGWQSGSDWMALISDYKLEAWINDAWVEIGAYDVKIDYNYAEDYHVYGMNWTADDISFYFDDKLIRTIPNTQCNEELSIWLSLAILEYAGEVTDAVDGTSMKIDYVRYYQPNE
ncbi:MAG: family 16 glycosylhydrolase [Reichenbachiella sp.]